MRITIQPGVNTPYNGGIVRSRWRYVRVICLTLSTCLAPQFPNERRRMAQGHGNKGASLVSPRDFRTRDSEKTFYCCFRKPERIELQLLAPGKPVVYRPSDLSQGAVKLTAEESPVDPRIAACQARCVRVIVFGEGRSCRPRHRHSWRCESICALPRRDIEPR
ncbi:hypothetical protein Bbelb_430380 [Branchiostoma belcheri]|nr:hypothetical protein Bbelb_430380 [Branchiostoma belcheri]